VESVHLEECLSEEVEVEVEVVTRQQMCGVEANILIAAA
jgi:hypothetical protein